MTTSKGVDTDKLAVQRQLKIKVGVTKRLHKELNLYRKEAEDNKRKLDRIVADNGEEWDIKNAKRIFEESERMIKDTSDRLDKAVQELKALVDPARSRPEFSEDEELLGAEKELSLAEATLAADKSS